MVEGSYTKLLLSHVSKYKYSLPGLFQYTEGNKLQEDILVVQLILIALKLQYRMNTECFHRPSIGIDKIGLSSHSVTCNN